MTTSDHYRMHRLALLPLVAEQPQHVFERVGSAFPPAKEEQFLTFILQQGLGPLWHEALKECEPPLFSTNFRETLKAARLKDTARYLRQFHTIKKVDDLFRAESISYAVFKGAHIRELVYSVPAVRPACDIDILISKDDQETAIKALVSTGYTFRPLAENISHEATLTDGHVSIDLHWDIMRPGRTRKDMTDELLAARKEFAGYWGLNDEATLFIMLVHPVITKYLNSPNASLMRMVDLAYWVEERQPDWVKVYSLLKQTGLCTAAWTMLEWLKTVSGIDPPPSFMEKTDPGPFKSRYLRHWIRKDYSTRFFNNSTIIKVAFTLPLHDKVSDAMRAIRSLAYVKQSAARKTEVLKRSSGLKS